MNEAEFEQVLKSSFSTNYKLDDELKSKTMDLVLQNKRLKEEKTENILLIIIQMLMFVFTVTILAMVFIFDLGNVLALLFTVYILGCSVVALVIVINNKKIIPNFREV